MFPGMNPRQLEQAMKKMGIKQEEIEASEVIIKGKEKQYIIRNPQIIKMNMMGQESLQVTGTLEEVSSITEEDIKTVASQANVSEAEAKQALEESNGDLAEAILHVKK